MYDFEEKLPSDIPIVVLDTETTGLFPGTGHRIVEIGAIRLENWQVTGELNQLIQPDRKMESRASSVNGIVDADLVGKPTFTEFSDQLLNLLEGALLVAHNASFDAGFLGMEFFISSVAGRAGDEDPSLANLSLAKPLLANPWLCTLQLARRHFYFGRNNLEHIARRLGVRMGVAHRALNDVYMTAEILKRMIHELSRRRLQTVGDLLHAQGGPIYTPSPPTVILPELIADALAESSPLRLLYMGKYGESERIITPRYPSQFKGVSYLIAHCHLRQDQRTFRLDRILSAEPAPET